MRTLVVVVCLEILLSLAWPVSAGLLFSADFESDYSTFDTCSGGTCPSGFPSVPNASAIARVSSPVRSGTKSVMHEAHPGQIPGFWSPCFLFGTDYTATSDCDRSESEKAIQYFAGRDEWYGFSIFIDQATQYTAFTAGGFADFNGQVFFQAHQLDAPCNSGYGPRLVLYFSVRFGDYEAVLHAQNNILPACATIGASLIKTFSLGTWSKGQWTDFVIHAKWSTGADGVLEIWRDGTRKVNYSGPTSFNGFKRSDIKIGVYQSWWRDHTVPLNERSIVYHDDVKIGNQFSNYAEVAPGGTQPPIPAPTNFAVG